MQKKPKKKLATEFNRKATMKCGRKQVVPRKAEIWGSVDTTLEDNTACRYPDSPEVVNS